MQSYGHRLHIWSILQLQKIRFLRIYQSFKIFAYYVYNYGLSIYFLFYIFCLSQMLLSSATRLKPLRAENVSACKYKWQLAYKQYHNSCNNDNLSYHLSHKKTLFYERDERRYTLKENHILVFKVLALKKKKNIKKKKKAALMAEQLLAILQFFCTWQKKMQKEIIPSILWGIISVTCPTEVSKVTE